MNRRQRATLDQIETWIFDLDNTLYPASCNVYVEVEARMNAFIMTEFSLDEAAARELRRHYFETHGTTLRGLMLDYGLPPKRFLDYVHDVDLSSVPPDPELVAAIAALPGRKLVFTNGSERHAERLLDRLALAEHFSGIHDIVACDYVPKPHRSGYERLIQRHEVRADRAAMIEDMAPNLAPAAELGMTTVFVPGGPHHTAADAPAPYIDYVVEALAPWLAAAVRI